MQLDGLRHPHRPEPRGKVFDPLVTKTAERRFPSCICSGRLGTRLCDPLHRSPQVRADRPPRIGPHRQEVDGTGPVVAPPVAVAEQAREPTARPDGGRDSRDRWHVRGKGEISMTTRDRVRMPAVLSVGARGFEPLTSSASRKRSPPELSARGFGCYRSLRGGDLHRVSGAARMSARD